MSIYLFMISIIYLQEFKDILLMVLVRNLLEPKPVTCLVSTITKTQLPNHQGWFHLMIDGLKKYRTSSKATMQVIEYDREKR